MQCPACRIGLIMTEKQGIEIDYCPQCFGIWLDRGELHKLIEKSYYSPAEVAPHQPSPYGGPGRRPSVNSGEPVKYRKKSFFERLFD